MEPIENTDFRKHRARHLAAVLTHELQDVLPQDSLGEVNARLFDALYRNGAAWTVEEERQKLGFAPRDDKGWILSEREEAMRLKRDAMMALAAHCDTGHPDEVMQYSAMGSSLATPAFRAGVTPPKRGP